MTPEDFQAALAASKKIRAESTTPKAPGPSASAASAPSTPSRTPKTPKTAPPRVETPPSTPPSGVAFPTNKEGTEGYVLPEGTSFGDAVRMLNAPEPVQASMSPRVEEPRPLREELQTPPALRVSPTGTVSREAPGKAGSAYIEDIPGASREDLAKAEKDLANLKQPVGVFGRRLGDGLPGDAIADAEEKVRHINTLRTQGKDVLYGEPVSKTVRGMMEGMGSAIISAGTALAESGVSFAGEGIEARDASLKPETQANIAEAVKKEQEKQEQIKTSGPGAVRARQHAEIAEQHAGEHIAKTIAAVVPNATQQSEAAAFIEETRVAALSEDVPEGEANNAFVRPLADYFFKQDGGQDLSTEPRYDADGEMLRMPDGSPASDYADAQLAALKKAQKVLVSLRAEGEAYWPHSVNIEEINKDPTALDYLAAWYTPSRESTEGGGSVRTQNVLMRGLGMLFPLQTIGGELVRGALGGDTNYYQALRHQSFLTDRVLLDWRHVPQMAKWKEEGNPLFYTTAASLITLDLIGPDIATMASAVVGSKRATKLWKLGQELIAEHLAKGHNVEGQIEAAKGLAGGNFLEVANALDAEGHKEAAQILRARGAGLVRETPEGAAVQDAFKVDEAGRPARQGDMARSPEHAREGLPQLRAEAEPLRTRLAELDAERELVANSRREKLEYYDEALRDGRIEARQGGRDAVVAEENTQLAALRKESAPLRARLSTLDRATEAIESGAHQERFTQASDEAMRTLREQAALKEGAIADRPHATVFPNAVAEAVENVPRADIHAAFGEVLGADFLREAEKAGRIVGAADIKALLQAAKVDGKNGPATMKLAEEILAHVLAAHPKGSTLHRVLLNIQAAAKGDHVAALRNLLRLGDDPAALDHALNATRNRAALAQIRVDEAQAALLDKEQRAAGLAQAQADLAHAEGAVEAGKLHRVSVERAAKLEAEKDAARARVAALLDTIHSHVEGSQAHVDELRAALKELDEAQKEVERTKLLAAPIARPKPQKATSPVASPVAPAPAAAAPAPTAPPPRPADPVAAAVQDIQVDGGATGPAPGLAYALQPLPPLQAQQRRERFDVMRLFFGASGEPFSRQIATYRPKMDLAARQVSHLLHLALERDFTASTGNALWKYLGGPEAADFCRQFKLPSIDVPLTPRDLYTYRVQVTAGNGTVEKVAAYNPAALRKRRLAGELLIVKPVSLVWSDKATALFGQLDALRVAGRDTANTTNNWLRSLLPFSDPAMKAGEEGLVRLRDSVLVTKPLGVPYLLPMTRGEAGLQDAYTAVVVGFENGKVRVQPYQYIPGTVKLDRQTVFEPVLLDAADLEYMERGRVPRADKHTRPMTHAEWAVLRAEEDGMEGARALSYAPEVRARMAPLNPPERATLTSFYFKASEMSALEPEVRAAVLKAEQEAAFLGVRKPEVSAAGERVSAAPVEPPHIPGAEPTPAMVTGATEQAQVHGLPYEWQQVQDALAAQAAAKKAVAEAARGVKPVPESLLEKLRKADEEVARLGAGPPPVVGYTVEQEAARRLADAKARVSTARLSMQQAASAAKALEGARPIAVKRLEDAEASLELALSAHREVKDAQAAARDIPAALEKALGAAQDARRGIAERMAAEAAAPGEQAALVRERVPAVPARVTPARAMFEQGYRTVANRLGRTEETAGMLRHFENLANSLHARFPESFPTPDAFYSRFVFKSGTDAQAAKELAALGEDGKKLAHADSSPTGLWGRLDYRKSSEKTAKHLLRFVEDQAAESFRQDIGEIAYYLRENFGTFLDDVPVHLDSQLQKRAGAYGIYEDGAITLASSADEQTGLHEVLHALTFGAIEGRIPLTDKGRAALGNIKELFEVAVHHHAKAENGTIVSVVLDGPYGFRNIHEFVAEAFSNPSFQAVLKSIPAPRALGASLWDRFVESIARLIGFEKTDVLGHLIANTHALIADATGVKTGTNTLAHMGEDTLKGLADFTDAERILLTFFKTADAETLAHEPAHVLAMLLPPEVKGVIEQALSPGHVPGAAWTREMEEAFAHQYSAYLRNGVVPTRAGASDAFAADLAQGYQEVAESMRVVMPEEGAVNPVLREQLDQLHAASASSTTRTVGGYGNQDTLRRQMQALKAQERRVELAKTAQGAWEDTLRNVLDFMRPSRDVMEQSLNPVIRQMVRMETGQWDVFNRSLSNAMAHGVSPIGELKNLGYEGDFLEVLRGGTRPPAYGLARTAYLDLVKLGELTPEEALVLDKALRPEVPVVGDTAQAVADRLFAASEDIILARPAKPTTGLGKIFGQGPGPLRPRVVGDAMFAQAAGLGGLHNRLLKEGIGVGMTIGAADARATRYWTSGWDVPGVDADRAQQVVLQAVDPNAYRSPLESLIGNADKDLAAIRHPFGEQSVGHMLLRATDTVNQEVYVPRAIRDRMELQINEVVATQRLSPAKWLSLQIWKQNLTMGYLSVKPWYHWVNHFSDLEQTAAHVGISEALTLGATNQLHNLVFGTAGFSMVTQVADAVRGVRPGTTIAEADRVLAKASLPDIVAAIKGAVKRRDPALDGVVQRGGFGQDTTAIMDAGRYDPVAGRVEDVIITTKDGRKFSARSLYKIFAAEGVYETQGFGELVRMLKDTEPGGGDGWLSKGRRALQARTDAVQDVANFIALRQRVGLSRILIEGGKDPYEAARITVESLYDYKHSLHPVERNDFWQFFNPFWTYKKNNSARAMRDAMLFPGLARIGRVHVANQTATTTLTYAMDERDPVGFDVQAMQQDTYPGYDPYQLYQDGMAKLHARGLTDMQVFDMIRAGQPVPELDEVLVQYWTDDPKRSMLPTYVWERIVAYRQIPRTRPNQDTYLKDSGKKEKAFDEYRAIVLPDDSNIGGLDMAVTTAVTLIDMYQNSMDAGARTRFGKNFVKVFGDPARNPATVLILGGFLGIDVRAFQKELPPGIGAALNRWGGEMASRAKTVTVQGEVGGPDPKSAVYADAYSMPSGTAAAVDLLGGVGPAGGALSLLNTGIAVEKAGRAVLGLPKPGAAPDSAAWDVLEAGWGQKSKVYGLKEQEDRRDTDAERRQAPWFTRAEGDVRPLTDEQTGDALFLRSRDDLSHNDVRRMGTLWSSKHKVDPAQMEAMSDDELLRNMQSSGYWKPPLDTSTPTP